MSRQRGNLRKRYQAIAEVNVANARTWRHKAQVEANITTQTRVAFHEFAEEANRIMEESAAEQYAFGYDRGYEHGLAGTYLPGE